ncbi:T9SS type A sorting domain-containing protein [Telluribacter sp. SYSU D00476]|uniref:T9SS type A sorting domain-containing protein n=1 Tax=Telluribacter sp. SYSU D00476 TaxID=2811430 RepID=UPI001FF640FB|nr:T9SS type A sorting domain-containing protein [Telluribacter sp. SYSU D00476]
MKNFRRNNLLTHNLKRGTCLALLVWLWAVPAWAQLELVPIIPPAGESVQTTGSTKQSARTQALRLPVFDDFSTSNTFPDPTLWMPGSGVYINNVLTTTHPSINIATFDGLNAAGVPYNFVNEQAQGDTDTLTTQPIDLGGLTAADSVYLSFYWQARGLGELPDDVDTFRLEFLNQKGDWISVWKQSGAVFDTLYKHTFIPVRDASYLHAGFRFRFRGHGRSSGAFDSWHLDYIYLNRNRSINDRFIKDVAVRQPLTSFLKRYTAMPLDQYWLNPAAETADSIRTDIVNLFNNFNFTSYTFTIRDQLTGREIQRYQEPLSVFIGPGQTQKKAVRLTPIARQSGVERLRLKLKFDLLTTDDQNPTIPSVNLRRNDTISTITELADYYAYDDGSAEFGVRMNQRLGRTVVRFVLNRPDTLGGVRMALVPFRRNQTGQAFTIQVWNSSNGRPDRVVHQQSVRASYGTTRNGYVDFPFANGVAVTDTFYVGWLQIGEDPLTVGFDRNSQLGASQLYTNLSNEWAGNLDLKGSVMIRPYVGGKDDGLITGSEPLPALQVRVYPNPTSGTIQWDSDLIRQIEVYSAQGIPVRVIVPSDGVREASLSHLPEGMYVLRITDGQRTAVQKLVIRK